MVQVVAADRQGVAVTGDDPDREVFAGGGQAGGQCRGAPVNAVHAVGVHVVRESARAADPGHEHDLVRRDPELGHELLNRRQHRVVAATGAPAGLLVGLKITLCERLRPARPLGRAAVAVLGLGAHFDPPFRAAVRAMISRSISEAKIGCPSTLQKDSTSTRNRDRSSMASCPEFISGTSTRSNALSTSPVFGGSGLRLWTWAKATL